MHNITNKRISAFSVLVLVAVFLFFTLTAEVFSQTRKEVISEKNEFGGRTIEYTQGDYSIYTEYFDVDGNKAKEETIFSSDYPIDNNLRRLNVYYFFGKKTYEERIFTSSYASRTLIKRSIDHFDRHTGDLIRRENHFVRPFTEYNVIFRENGKKTIIEWHYPDNIDGIKKNVSYLDDNEQIVRTESFYTDKTIEEKGYFKRIYYTEYNINKYKRKSRQEWYYTPEYAEQNHGIVKKVELFHYALARPVRVESFYYDKEEKLVTKD
ncbi:MAG: hypothetical protein MJE63_24765 [Proteobacteria bacterium]|nr:hypothetical protein [Pseudomonadota bacterium]